MGKVTNSAAAVMFILLYLVISLFYINKFLSNQRKMVISSNLQAQIPTSAVEWNAMEFGRNGTKLNGSLVKDFAARLRRMLEIDRSDFGHATKLEHETDRHNKNLDTVLPPIRELNPLREEGSGLVKGSRICKSLVSGSDKLRWKAMQKIKSNRKKFGIRVYSDKNLTNVFDTCERIFGFIRGSSILQDEKPIAYSILLNRPADQTFQLLRAIYHPSNVYCLHVHSDATKRYFTLMKKLASCIGNVYLADRRHRLTFATHERIQAHIACHRMLLNTSMPWKYVINIPGSVFPLRNNTFIAEYLDKRTYLNSISYGDPLATSFLRRVNYVHQHSELPNGYKIFARTKKRKKPPPHQMKLFRSDVSFVATRGFAEFVVTSSISRKLLDWAKDTKSPDEFFWATLDRHPGAPGGAPYRSDMTSTDDAIPGKEDVYFSSENDLVAKLWKGQRTPRCGGKYASNLCTFSYKDLRWLLGQDSLFADAFDMKFDNVAIGCLYKNLKQPLVEDYQSKMVNYNA